MNVTPTFQGEFQFRRYSDTSTQGQQVVFAVADREALESFIGKEGKRFMAVLVQIGDDEQPVPPAPKDHSWSRQAGIWCQDKEFQRWVSECSPKTAREVDADVARSFIVIHCEITSRKQLDTNEEARKLWLERIAGPYKKWRIARGLE